MKILGLNPVLRTLAGLPKQARFAAAGALNDCARDVQRLAVDDLLPDKFTLRAKSTPWQKPGSKFGFNIRPFARRDNLTAVIGSQADWLARHERGTHTKTISGHNVPIPTPALKPHEAITPRALKPSALLSNAGSGRRRRGRLSVKARPFVYRGSAMRPGIYIRTPQGLRSLYVFEKSVRINTNLRFEDKGKALAERNFPAHFQKRFKQALLTAK